MGQDVLLSESLLRELILGEEVGRDAWHSVWREPTEPGWEQGGR